MTKKKMLKTMIGELSAMVGEQNAGFLIAGLLDALHNLSKGKDYVEMRSLKFVVNNFFEYEILEKSE